MSAAKKPEAESAVLDPAGFRSRVDAVHVSLGPVQPKKSVVRFDHENFGGRRSGPAPAVWTLYVSREAYAALGSPEHVRLTIERA
jgi:hypothetical protein